MSMQVISQDHYTTEVVYAPGTFSYTPDKVGTRYVYLIIRTLADPENADDVKAANALQDAIKVEQASTGKLELPNWERTSQDKVRNLLNEMSTMRGSDIGAAFGARGEVDPISHLIGTAIGWAAIRVRRRSIAASTRKRTTARPCTRSPSRMCRSTASGRSACTTRRAFSSETMPAAIPSTT
jgi:hypothetical protein